MLLILFALLPLLFHFSLVIEFSSSNLTHSPLSWWLEEERVRKKQSLKLYSAPPSFPPFLPQLLLHAKKTKAKTPKTTHLPPSLPPLIYSKSFNICSAPLAPV